MNKSTVKSQIEKIETMTAKFEDGKEFCPTVSEIPIMSMVLDEVLKGTHPKTIKKILNDQDIPISQQRLNSVIKLARKEIGSHAYKDYSVNYAWAEANLKDVHSRAVASGDDRMRVVVIKELINLWQLDQEQVEEREITDDMIEQFEQRLLR